MRSIDLGKGSKLNLPDAWKVRQITPERPWIVIIDPEAQRANIAKRRLSAKEKRRRLQQAARERCQWCGSQITETREGNEITFHCKCRPLSIQADPGWPEDYDNDQARLFPRE